MSLKKRKEHDLQFKAMLDLSPEVRIQAMKKLPPKNENLKLIEAIVVYDPNPSVQQFALKLIEQHSPA